LSRNSGVSTSGNPKGLSGPVAGKLYLYLLFLEIQFLKHMLKTQLKTVLKLIWTLVILINEILKHMIQTFLEHIECTLSGEIYIGQIRQILSAICYAVKSFKALISQATLRWFTVSVFFLIWTID
jgi:hypothetical protein